jgi:hypothetical protein
MIRRSAGRGSAVAPHRRVRCRSSVDVHVDCEALDLQQLGRRQEELTYTIEEEVLDLIPVPFAFARFYLPWASGG